MKETIYTIPINEALEKESFCPFCKMYEELEQEAVRYAVGAAMMEPDFRAITNEKGFCRKHMRDLNAESKALALALVFDTHLDNIENIMSSNLKAEKKGIFKKGEDGSEKYLSGLKHVTESCTICARIEHTFLRYMENFVYMLKKEPEFAGKVLKCEGFCMEHFYMLFETAKKELSSADFEKYFVPIAEHQKKRVEKYHKYIKTFVESFDYNNAGKPMDAPKDTLIKTSFLLNGEFKPKAKKLDDI